MKVLFVCTGNTCRSPMIEHMFRKYVQDRGVADIQVDSAGLMANGECTSDMCSIVLSKYCIPHEIRPSKTIDEALFLDSDFIFTMTQEQADIIDKTFSKGKTYALSSRYHVDIPDPYGKDEEAYRQIFLLFDCMLNGILYFVKPDRRFLIRHRKLVP